MLDRKLVDPRRPEKPTEEDKEEGLFPYHPVVPIIPNAHLSYNLTIARLSSITSAPAERESTSVVLAWGLDVFCATAAPAKTYDKLNDDFNFALLILTTTVLAVR